MIEISTRKVAFLGSATSSRSMAPFGDPDWEIWATGPGCHLDPNFKSQFHRWFELHDMAENDPVIGAVLDPGYFEWLQKIQREDGKTVYYRPPLYQGLKGELFPWDELKARHCGYFLDSTVAWMMALALDIDGIEEIGLWGIDFATEPERILQRKGAKHFIELFKHKGVKVTIPEVSDMAFDPAPYPDVSQLGKKLANHIALIQPERAKTEKNIEELKAAIVEQEKHLERIKGTMQTLEYGRDNWA